MPVATELEEGDSEPERGALEGEVNIPESTDSRLDERDSIVLRLDTCEDGEDDVAVETDGTPGNGRG